MARHDGPFRGQVVDELRIAVIHDVEEIEPIALRFEPTRIVPQPVTNPVGIEHDFWIISVNSRKSSPHRRAQPDGFEVSVKLPQTLLKHQSDEIHARPILFKQIADKGDSRCAALSSQGARSF